MTHYFCKRQLLRPLRLLLGLMIMLSYLAFAQASSEATEQSSADITTLSGGKLSLNQVALITMRSSPTFKSGKLGVQIARASAQMMTGMFDIHTSVTANVNKSRPILDMMDEDRQGLNLALNKLFRTGISSSVSVGITRADDRVGILPPPNTNNSSNFMLNITIPLLKGRGYVSAAADEKAAQLDSQAAEYRFFHEISRLLLDSTNAYWDYTAAIKHLKIQQAAEQRIQKWADDAESQGKLRYGDTFSTKYATKMSRIRGYLADKQRNTIAATERVNSTKGALAVVMGIPSEQVAKIGEPSEEFDADWSTTLAELERRPMQDKWTTIAKEKRLDIIAAKLEQEATTIRLAKARRDMSPRLDFGINTSHNADEYGDGYSDYVGALNGDTRGTDVGATLTFSYPLGNNMAKGQHDLANASHNMKVIATQDLMRTIGVNVGVDTGTLVNGMKATVETSRAVILYDTTLQKSYDSFRESLLEDSNVIINLLDLDEKLTDAADEFLKNLQELAKSIAQLRFQTGTILTGASMDAESLQLGELAKLPSMQDMPE